MFVERFGACVYGVMCNHCLVNGPKVEHGKYLESETDDEAERDAIRMWNACSPEAHKRVLGGMRKCCRRARCKGGPHAVRVAPMVLDFGVLSRAARASLTVSKGG